MADQSASYHVSRRTLMAGAALASLSGVARAMPAPGIVLKAPGDRAISVSVWRAGAARRGVILFSHGALSAPWKYEALLGVWAAAGYDIFAPLHVDSTDHPDTARYPGLANWRCRMEDMHLLADHVGLPFIAAGHSYGAMVALTLGGASAIPPPGYDGPMRDARTRIVVAFSPPAPAPTLISEAGYATLAVPAFVQTGTRDSHPIGNPDWHSYLTAYYAPPAGGHRYGLILAGVDHYFGNVICRPERLEPPQTEAFARATMLALLFMRAYAGGDVGARQRLDRHLATGLPTQLMTR